MQDEDKLTECAQQLPPLPPVGDVPFQGKPAGVSGGDAAPLNPVEVYSKKFSSAATLAELSKEFGFYTPALLHLFIPMPVDPLHHFRMEYGEDIQPFSIEFKNPIFRGLEAPNGDSAWNRVLFGIERPAFEAFIKHIGTVAWYDKKQQPPLFVRVRTQDFMVADPYVIDRAAVLPEPVPTAPITALVLDASFGCRYLQAGKHPVLEPPKLISSDLTYKDTRDFAKALGSSAANPYDAIDATKE